MTDTAAAALLASEDAAAGAGAQNGAEQAQNDGQAQQQQGNEGGADKAAKENASWYGEVDDPELKGWLENKKFPGVKDALASYRALEQHLGAKANETVILPKGADDKEGWDRLHKAVGRPDEPGGYKLPIPEGSDPTFASKASEWFHEAGIGQKQAEGLAGKWNAFVAEQQAQAEQQFAATSKAELEKLTGEWGAEAPANREMARRAMRQFGLGEEKTLGALERALGTRKMMETLAAIGKGLAEDTFEGGEGQKGFGMSADAARARIATLQNDKDWQTKFINGGTAEKDEWDRLHKIAYPAAA